MQHRWRRYFRSTRKYGAGIVGPGHGIQIATGDDSGRLLIPAHSQGSAEALYSDDQGGTWVQSEPVGLGNESEITETWDDQLIKVVRGNHPVSQPHDELQALFSFSEDGDLRWSEAPPNPFVNLYLHGLDPQGKESGIAVFLSG